MKIIIASVLALGLVSAPALAQNSNMMSSGANSTKTMVTRGHKSTAVTTVSTKVMPNAEAGERGESGAKENMERHHARHHARMRTHNYCHRYEYSRNHSHKMGSSQARTHNYCARNDMMRHHHHTMMKKTMSTTTVK